MIQEYEEKTEKILNSDEKQFKQSKLSLAEYEYLPEKVQSFRSSKKPRILKSQSLIDLVPSSKLLRKASQNQAEDSEAKKRSDLSHAQK